MVHLNDIEVEVLASVFEYLVNTSPQSAFSFGCTSKYYYSSYQLLSHRQKRITHFQYPKSGDHLLDVSLDAWLADRDIIRGLRHLSIDCDRVNKTPKSYPSRPQFLGLVTLLQHLCHLTLLDWNIPVPVPLPILDALHTYQPDAELRVSNFVRSKLAADENDPVEIALSKSPALTAIKTDIYDSGEYPDLRLACFQRIVASAPNLRYASVSESSHQGCLDFSLTKDQRERQKPLEQRFHAHQKPNAALRLLALDGFHVCSLSRADWAKFLDLTQLQDLRIFRGYFDVHHLNYGAQTFGGLKHLSLDLRCTSRGDVDGPETVEDFLSSLAPLRSLRLWSFGSSVSLAAILLRHGPTLEALQLHGVEDSRDPPRLLTAKEVESIRLTCPFLRDLRIDRTRHTEALDTELDVDEVLHELAKMTLATLHIHYDLDHYHLAGHLFPEDDFFGFLSFEETDSPPNPGSPPRKFMPPSGKKQIEAFAERLWKHMFAHHPRTSPRVLDLKFSQFVRPVNFCPSPWPSDWQAKRIRWQVRSHERDDRHGECVVAKLPRVGGGGRVRWG